MTTTVWRVVYDLAGITMRSDWSVHHDMIREYADEFSQNMPGTDVRIESASVEQVEVIGTQSVQVDPDDVDAEDDPNAPYNVSPDYDMVELYANGDENTD